MKTFGIKISVLIFACFSFSQISISQNNIDPCLCNRKDCGDIIASFKLVSNSTVVCDGYEFEVQNNSTIPDVSYYIWSWGDGTKDSVATTSNQKHIYNIPLGKVCLDNQTTYQICLLAVKRCGTIYSCHNNNSPVTVIHRPVARFTYKNSICKNEVVSFNGMPSCNEDENDQNSYLWTFHDGTKAKGISTTFKYASPGLYTVKLKVFNSCGENEISQTIEVVDLPDTVVDISATAKDSIVCIGDRVMLINQSNQWSKIKWKFPANTVLNDTLKWKLLNINKVVKGLNSTNRQRRLDSLAVLDTIIFDVFQAGTYIFEMVSQNACGDKKWTFPLKVVAAPTVTLNSPPTFCEIASYTPIVNVTGIVNSYTWSFPGGNPASSSQKDPGPISFGTPGTYTLTLKANAECDTITRSVQLVVNSRDPVTITDPNKIFCRSSSPDTLRVDRTGGIWSGQGITNVSLGVFDPGTLSPGNYVITYTVGPVGCQSIGNITLQVVASENVIISDTILCENTPVTQLVASPATGIWSGHPAVTASGLFDPSLSGIDDFSIDYVYQDINGCTIEKNINVTVEAFPIISASDTSVICVGSGMVSLEEILNINVNPSGGTFSFFLGNISVPDLINLQNYNVSVLPVTIIYKRNQCEVRDSAFISFREKPVLSITNDTIICIDELSFELVSNISGGEWSGPGIDKSTGVIDLNAAGQGVKNYSYLYQSYPSCEQMQSMKITIKDPGSTLTAGPNEEICQGPVAFTLSGNMPSGGKWTGVGINETTGQIDLTLLKMDSLYMYKYCLEDASIQGCEACRSKMFIVHSLPIPLFDIDGLTCINENITIIDQTPGNNTILFNLGDGTTSNADSITHQYTNQGNYTITLQVTNPFLCSASTSEEIYVTTRPISAFTLFDDEGCAPFELILSNQSSGDGISYLWNINNTTYTEAIPPSIILDNITKDSTFIISLAVTNQCGTVEYSDSVQVQSYPIVDFGVSEQSGCSPLTIEFANTSLGSPTTFFWDMGNGNIYTDSIPPAQTYTTPNDRISTYNILYVGTNLCGIDSLTKIITIFPPDITAFIEAPGLSLCQYDTLVLTAFSTPGAINTWKLIAPDGTLSGTNGDLATFEMTQSGNYTAILYASRCGTDTDTVIVNVLPAPFVDFELPAFVCAGSPVSFTNLGIGIGGIIWDYGDGNTDASGKHVFNTPGIYSVTLTAFSLINNCPFSVTKQIRVIGLPTASFTPSVFSGCEPLEISFANSSTSNSNFDWNFGDMTSNSAQSDPTHVFQNDGTFQVKLTVYDAFGCFSDTSILNIIVHPKPESKFTFPNQKYCHRYDSIPFTNLSIGSVGQEWILNGQAFNTLNITWLPLDSGIFNVALIAESTFGCKDSSRQILEILPSPTSSFVTDKENGCEDLTVNFTNLSASATQYIWDLNNGTSSVEKDLSYTFTSPGVYDARLISLLNNGCPPDTSLKTITVHPKPIAEFDIQKDSVCGAPMFVEFINNSTGNIDNVWYVNGSMFSQDPNFNHIFGSASTNDISLIVQNEFLCADTIHKTLDIYLQPKADFAVREQACEGDILLIENKSTNAVSYLWNIESQGTTTVSQPELIFEASGTYGITLIASYNAFCKDTFSLAVPIRIYDSPTADFDYQGGYDENILGEVRFNNLSIDYDRSLWDFGDGNMSEEESPVHEYDINRNLLVKLTVYNDNNGLYTCIDSITKPVAPEWITTFFAPNALSPEYGDGDVKVFKPVGVGLATYKISVYSPWGQAVWTSDKLENTSPVESWDGTYNNAIVPQGAYSWMADVTFVNGIRKVYKGSVTVVR